MSVNLDTKSPCTLHDIHTEDNTSQEGKITYTKATLPKAFKVTKLEVERNLQQASASKFMIGLNLAASGVLVGMGIGFCFLYAKIGAAYVSIPLLLMMPAAGATIGLTVHLYKLLQKEKERIEDDKTIPLTPEEVLKIFEKEIEAIDGRQLLAQSETEKQKQATNMTALIESMEQVHLNGKEEGE